VSLPTTWTELRVSVSAEAAEAVAEILRELRGGGLVEEHPTAGRRAAGNHDIAAARVRFRCYLPPSRLLSATLRAVRTRIRALRRYGLDPGRVTVAHRRVRGRRWATAWRAHAKAVRIGRLVIRPSWVRAAPRPGDVVVAIDPGMAFGTGMHASTRLALRGLATALGRRRGAAVIDVGTGSGILAIAAAALGARSVWAADSDPIATAAARANARLNGYARRVRVLDASGLGSAPGGADVIVANIVADTIVDLLPDAGARLGAGGVFIGSGIVTGRVGAVLRAARAAGLQKNAVLREGDWRAVVLSARPRSGSPPSAARRIPRGTRR
jgi:ribosomal protein L11 methyltransferase